MTNQELQELSQRVAEKFGVEKPKGYLPDKVHLGMTERWGETEHGNDLIVGWLHKDLATVMRLAIEHRCSIDTSQNNGAYIWHKDKLSIEYYQDHPTREQAVIVSVMKALCEVEV